MNSKQTGDRFLVLVLLISASWEQNIAKESDLMTSVDRFDDLFELKKEDRLSVLIQMVSHFESVLDDFINSSPLEDNASRNAILCDLLCRVLVGVFRMKTDLTKELLAEGTLASVYNSNVVLLSPWITQPLRATLERVNTLKIADLCTCENAMHTSQPFLASVFELGLWSSVKRSSLEDILLCPNCTSSYNLDAWYQILTPVLANQDSTALGDILHYVGKCLNDDESLHALKTMAYSVAYVQCQSGLSCVIINEVKSFMDDIFSLNHVLDSYGLTARFLFQSVCDSSHDTNNHVLPSCNPFGIFDVVRSDFVNFQQLGLDSGWRPQSSFESAAFTSEPSCGLPQIHISQLTSDTFLNVFVKFSIPVIIKGLSTRWSSLWTEFTRHSLLKNYGSVDFLGGQIPYGEVFGDIHGYTTMEEFVQYMDTYESDYSQAKPSLYQPPMYIFDPEFLQKYAKEYTLPDDLLVWQDSRVLRQFILGPAGSGAPFHHHCPAFNTVFYGLKSWYLLPPGQAFYSKTHPLNWFDKEQLTSQYICCSQGPGDTLFVPQGWSHATVNIRETVAVAMEIDNELC